MAQTTDNIEANPFPPRVKAAFRFLDHVRATTFQWDSAIPARQLTPLEQNVQKTALRALQQYLLGEMDFVEPMAAGDSPNPQSGNGVPQPPTDSSA